MRLLGPLEVRVGGRSLELGKGNEGSLVALLALQPNAPVPSEEIIDGLWPEAPSTAREMVRIYVGRARRRIGSSLIVTKAAGYALTVDPEHVDALRFARLCGEASRQLEERKLESVVASVEAALSLWRGTPLPELDAPFARGERRRLEELRLTAIEDRVDAELALGRAPNLIAELEALTREHPFRERVRAQLMLGLYRTGRQKDALEEFQRARRASVDELGVEPGPELQRLQRAILSHDPDLAVQARRKPGTNGVTASAERKKSHLRRKAGLVIAVIAVAVITVAALLVNEQVTPPRLSTNSVGAIDARTSKPIIDVHLGGLPGPLASTPSAIWVGDGEQASVHELNTRDLRPIHVLKLPGAPYRLATGFGAIWVANAFDGRLVKVDTASGKARVFRPEPQSMGRTQITTGYGAVWTASQDGILTRLDPDSLRPSTLIRGVGFPEAITAGLDGVWIAQANRDELLRVDPARNRVVRSIPIGGFASAVATGDGAVWAVTPDEGRVWRIDPHTNAVVAAISVGGRPTAVTTTAGAVWIGSADGTITRIDPNRNQVVATLAAHGAVAALAADGYRVWASVQ